MSAPVRGYIAGHGLPVDTVTGRDVEIGLQALDPISDGGRKVVLSSTIEGAREKLRAAMGKLETLRKKR